MIRGREDARAHVAAPPEEHDTTARASEAPGPSGPASSVPTAAASTWLGLRDLEREAAVTALFDSHHAQLVRLALLLGADGDAEDIASEAFCQLYLRWPRLRDPEAAPAYLRSVVCNQVRMRLRHLQVVRRRHVPQPPAEGSPEQRAVVREEHREVVQALNALPDRQRQAVVLRYWLDLSEAEVADAMGISCGAVKSHTSRAMAALTRALEERR